MNLLRKNSLLFAIFIFNSISYSQNSVAYSYNAFIGSVRQSNPLALQAENLKIYGETQLKAAKGNFDPKLSSNIESKQFNSYNYFTVGNAELKQQLYTSQYLKLGYQYGQGIYLNPESSVPLVGLPYVGLEASILQGLMFDKRRADVIKARFYNEFYDAEKNIQLNNLLFMASNTYVDALYCKKVNSLYNYFADLANQRLDGIIDLSKLGERPAIDTTEAAIFLQGRQLDRQAGEIELVKKINELVVLNPFTTNNPLLAITLTDSLEIIYILALQNVQSSINNSQVVNPILTQYKAKQKVLETERRLKREMIKPILDVSYNFLSTSNDVIMPIMNTNNYKWGASFSFPLFFRKPRNEFKMASLDTKNNDLEIINKQNQIEYKRNYIIEAIKITAAQITNAERSAAYSKLLVQAEKLKFMNGESSLFLLNSRESKWLETELKLVEYKLKFIKSYLELSYLNGDLKYEL